MRTPAGYRRIIAYGETGSGKTRILKAEADRYARAGGEVWSLDLRKQLPKPLKGMRIRPADDMDWSAEAPFAEYVNAWCAHALATAQARGFGMLLVIDETDLAIKPGAGLKGVPPALTRVVMQGRGHGVSYALAVRIPVEIPPVLRSQAEDLYLFRQTEPRYVAWMRERGVPDLPPIDSLPVGAYWHVRAGRLPHLHPHLFTPCGN